MGGAPFACVLSRLRHRIRDITVLRRRRKRANGVGVRGCGYGINEAHVGDVVEIDFGFEDDGESFPVQTYGEDGGREGELAYY